MACLLAYAAGGYGLAGSRGPVVLCAGGSLAGGRAAAGLVIRGASQYAYGSKYGTDNRQNRGFDPCFIFHVLCGFFVLSFFPYQDDGGDNNCRQQQPG